MELTTVWFTLIAVLWIGYFTLEGFDFGVGMLLPVLARDDTERRVMINTIGPVWDGNEVVPGAGARPPAGGRLVGTADPAPGTSRGPPMASRRSALVPLVLLGTVLAGCGGSDEPDPPAAAEVAEEVEEATSGDADLDGEADPGAALTAAQLCGFLTEQTPQVVDLQPAEYAAAIFGSALFAFYTDNGLLTDIDGADMDDLAAEGCPDVAAGILPVLGAGSFEELLSR